MFFSSMRVFTPFCCIFKKKFPCFCYKQNIDRKIFQYKLTTDMDIMKLKKSLFWSATFAGIVMSTGKAEITVSSEVRKKLENVTRQMLTEHRNRIWDKMPASQNYKGKYTSEYQKYFDYDNQDLEKDTKTICDALIEKNGGMNPYYHETPSFLELFNKAIETDDALQQADMFYQLGTPTSIKVFLKCWMTGRARLSENEENRYRVISESQGAFLCPVRHFYLYQMIADRLGLRYRASERKTVDQFIQLGYAPENFLENRGAESFLEDQMFPKWFIQAISGILHAEILSKLYKLNFETWLFFQKSVAYKGKGLLLYRLGNLNETE